MENDARLNRIEETLRNIENRLSVLEGGIPRLADVVRPKPAPASESLQPKVTPTNIHNAATQQAIYDKATGASSPRASSNSGTLLASVGILFFILAASFFIKLAIESGWLTPERQLAGAFIFGVVLIATGGHLREKDRAYASFLPAAGIVICFMAAYSGHLYYEIYGPRMAGFAVGAIALFSLGLFTYFRHDFFLVIAVLGTYAVPLLLNEGTFDPFANRMYFIIWDVLYCACAVFLGRRLLIGLTAYLAIGVWQLLLLASGVGEEGLADAILFQGIQFLVLSCAVGYFSVKRNTSLTALEAWAFLPVLVLFYTVEYAMLTRVAPGAAPWVAIGFGGVIYGIYAYAKARLNEGSIASSPMVATSIALILFHTVYLEILPPNAGPWFALAVMAGLTVLKQFGLTYSRFWPVYLVMYVIIGSEYFQLLAESTSRGGMAIIFLNLVFAGIFFWGYQAFKSASSKTWLLLGLATVQILRGLNRISETVSNHPVDAYLTSGLWAAFAMVLLVLGQQTRDSDVAKTGVFVFGAVAVKVLFFDISSSGSLARVIALVVIGALLYAGGLVWRRISEWK